MLPKVYFYPALSYTRTGHTGGPTIVDTDGKMFLWQLIVFRHFGYVFPVGLIIYNPYQRRWSYGITSFALSLTDTEPDLSLAGNAFDCNLAGFDLDWLSFPLNSRRSKTHGNHDYVRMHQLWRM
jgi:hypothetical protein